MPKRPIGCKPACTGTWMRRLSAIDLLAKAGGSKSAPIKSAPIRAQISPRAEWGCPPRVGTRARLCLEWHYRSLWGGRLNATIALPRNRRLGGGFELRAEAV